MPAKKKIAKRAKKLSKAKKLEEAKTLTSFDYGQMQYKYGQQ